MINSDLDKLRQEALSAFSKYFNSLTQEEQLCQGCIDFKWHHASLGVPENCNYAQCEFLGSNQIVYGNRIDTYRTIECLLYGLKAED